MRLTVLSCALLLLASLAAAQAPEITGVTNTASYLDPALPNGGVAQGGMATLFGTNLGPDPYVQVSTFPLETSLAGVSVQIQVGTTTVDAIPVVVWTNQVSVIVPSATPLGDGTVTLTYNGQTSAPFPVHIVAHAFGIFAINQGGSGPGVFTDANYTVNTLGTSARPGEVWNIWGTGLGPVAGDETAGPLPGGMNTLDVKVFVGGKQATLYYRGRSGCCAGIDQIAFYVPEGVTGCSVPVVVSVDGVPSNYVTMSIDPSGGTCSDPGGFSADDLAKAQSPAGLRLGVIELNRTVMKVTLPAPWGSSELNLDNGSATFVRYDWNRLIRSQSVSQILGYGACAVFQFKGEEATKLDPVLPDYLDAGPLINLNGPLGPRELPRGAQGIYIAHLSRGIGVVGDAQSDYLVPGVYALDNGAGGADVGPFQTAITIPQALQWTNQDQIQEVVRSQGVTVTWTGGDPARESVEIIGYSTDPNINGGAGFVCRERTAAASFHIPPVVLNSLPASSEEQGTPTGFLAVGSLSDPVEFTAPGIDKGRLLYTVLNGQRITYR